MNCPQCGAPNKNRDTYCVECGYRLPTNMNRVQQDQSYGELSRDPPKSTGVFLFFWLGSTFILFMLIYFLFKP